MPHRVARQRNSSVSLLSAWRLLLMRRWDPWSLWLSLLPLPYKLHGDSGMSCLQRHCENLGPNAEDIAYCLVYLEKPVWKFLSHFICQFAENIAGVNVSQWLFTSTNEFSKAFIDDFMWPHCGNNLIWLIKHHVNKLELCLFHWWNLSLRYDGPYVHFK